MRVMSFVTLTKDGNALLLIEEFPCLAFDDLARHRDLPSYSIASGAILHSVMKVASRKN
jgi:hypothetical protein